MGEDSYTPDDPYGARHVQGQDIYTPDDPYGTSDIQGEDIYSIDDPDGTSKTSLIELLESMKAVYRSVFEKKVTLAVLIQTLEDHQNNNPTVPGAELIASIKEEVDDSADSHDEDVDLLVEKVESGDWGLNQGFVSLSILENDVQEFQEEISEKTALFKAMLSNMEDTERTALLDDADLRDLIESVAPDSV